MFDPGVSPLVVDSSLDLRLRCCVLLLGVHAKESLIPLVFLDTWGSRVAALSPPAPLKLSLNSFAGCSNVLCNWSVELPELVLRLKYR